MHKTDAWTKFLDQRILSVKLTFEARSHFHQTAWQFPLLQTLLQGFSFRASRKRMERYDGRFFGNKKYVVQTSPRVIERHLHMLVSAGGLHEQDCRWIESLDFDKSKLMHMWRYAVITYLREAFKLGLVHLEEPTHDFEDILTKQYGRWWNIHISRFKTKWQFLRYAGRYIRRPPIAQNKFHRVDDTVVEFWRKDLRLREWVLTRYSPREFVALLPNHLPDRYKHAVRHFGLSSPLLTNRTNPTVFALLGQTKQSPTARLSWRMAVLKYFGVDPLRDAKGETMKWAGRIKPGKSQN